MVKRKHAFGIAALVVALLLTTGVAFAIMSAPDADNTQTEAKKAAYIQPASGKAVMTDRVVADPQQQRVVQQQPAQPACDDGNIVGTVAGGVAGGVVGSQFCKGNGKTATTIGGALSGAVLGNQFIPTHNVTCQ